MKKTTTSFFLFPGQLSLPNLQGLVNLHYLRLCLSALALACSLPLFAQNKLIEKANEHYKYNQYSDAAVLYEQALSQLDSAKSRRNTTAIKTKLANCYRMNNKMDKAEALYAEVVQDEKTKSETYLFYGETLMGTGKYDEAKHWFLQYQKLEPQDPKGPLMAESCEKALHIQPYFPFIDIQEFMFNSPADDNGPVSFGDGMVFSSDRKQGFKLLKEKSGWTGRDYLDLYFSKKQADGTYGEPEKFSSKLSEVNKNTGNASFTADGMEVFFTRNDNVVNKQKTYNLQIYSAQSVGEDRWKSVEKLPFCSPNFNFMHPAISPDGQWLFFTTNKSGGYGGTDIWESKRKKDGGWENPENLGPAINTAVNEGFPFMDKNGRLYFCSKGHPGFGGFDIFFTEKDENGEWKAPVNLGKPLNSPLDDISIYISPDQRSGMFTSSRKGGDDDIYLFEVLDHPPVEKTPPITNAALPEIAAPVQEEIQAMEAATLEEPASAPVEKTALEEPSPAKKDPVANEPKMPEPETLPVFEEEPHKEVEVAVEKAPEAGTAEQMPEPLPVFKENPEEKAPPKIAEAIIEEQPKNPTKTVEKQAVEISGEGISTFETEEKTPPTAPDDQLASIKEIPPIAENEPIANATEKVVVPLPSFGDFNQKLVEGTLRPGDHFRLDGAIYDPNIWQLTPRVSSRLDALADHLKRFPSLEVELGFHTEALGIDEDNQKLSENRAAMALDYLLKEGIAQNRISAIGYGESMPLNHCRNGVTCSLDEHLFNQRIEVKILAVGERQ